MNIMDWLRTLRHIFKLDPDKQISDKQLEMLVKSGTDAIIVGGTLGVTYDDTLNLLYRIRRLSNIRVIQEVSNLDSVVQGFDYYFIPLVLNAQDPEWILNAHHDAIKKFDELINWDQVLVEGYIILNDECSAAQLTSSKTELEQEDVIAYSTMCDKMLKLPILYIEYSGKYGDPNLLEDIKSSVNNSIVFYGGGITSKIEADTMKKYADTIVIGNLIYENFNIAIETVNIVL